MEKKKLHPSIEQFKEFVKKNPKVRDEVRSGNSTWQELYEDWYLLGEGDPRWNAFSDVQEKSEDTDQKTDLIKQIMAAVKKMDAKQIDYHINNLSQALSAVQGVISQFQSGKPTNPVNKNEHPPHPFMFRKD
jgi:hypothetical protein